MVEHVYFDVVSAEGTQVSLYVFADLEIRHPCLLFLSSITQSIVFLFILLTVTSAGC